MLNGVINVYKEKGFTSHDVVAKMRGVFRQKKIGHTGTLDPDAEGVLPVCLGSATKLCDILTDRTKSYEAVMLLGVETDTQDAGGTVLSVRDVACTEEDLLYAVHSFEGDYEQIPPMYSALKINGKKLCDLARKGIEVERKPRRVRIDEIRVKEITFPRVKMEVDCSKGTYIRTLCHDIGEKLSCGACMEKLLRTRAGQFYISEAHPLRELQEAADRGEPEKFLIPVDQCLSEYSAARAMPEADRFIWNGNPVREELFLPGSRSRGKIYRVYDSRNNFIGLYQLSAGGLFRAEKLFLGGIRE
ncbi:MAG: tRNA pseudouridine(55) synthase TruB [Stomatobaculum sp.]|nr:tRNA pseudouridine(55) synthase TruB [Stomatobaculum sp.]